MLVVAWRKKGVVAELFLWIYMCVEFQEVNWQIFLAVTSFQYKIFSNALLEPADSVRDNKRHQVTGNATILCSTVAKPFPHEEFVQVFSILSSYKHKRINQFCLTRKNVCNRSLRLGLSM